MAFRPVTPLEQASRVWELGNVPIVPGFYESGPNDELAGRTLPQIQLASPDFDTSNLRTPFPPGVDQLRLRLNSPSLKRPPRTPASIPVEKTTFAKIPWDICELIWNMRTPVLKYHHRKIENGSSGYSCLAKKAIFKELERREKDGGH
ncbi:hypothetical protein N7516_000917 [Penicillium verrucosum]|uniref:uncharacterized protein n=1 Tax=Penicillium verrucosum TaxID=60171 RepID=UPI0025456E70|nr:uncharacterized protein N7516_000917 [Penicillium verrucosum]KAJ5940749.1 hypothetical protein N7516_000917 [Penicillium verrucosum]